MPLYISLCCQCVGQFALRDAVGQSGRRGLVQGDMSPVPRPKPSTAHCNELPIPPGPDHLKCLARRFLDRLTGEQLRDLAAWCGQQQSVLQVGTLCSGTECPVLAWSAWVEALQEKLGVSPSWRQAMAAECDEKKQAVVMQQMTRSCNGKYSLQYQYIIYNGSE